MSEEQEKPKRKWYKSWSNILGIAVIVMIICGILAYIIISATSTSYVDPISFAYSTAREQIQNAVTAYQANNNNSLPILSGTYTNANCSNCSVINISALLTANGGMMRMAPDGLNLSASGNDNCGGNAILGCNNYSSYIWIVNTSGNIFSYCAGSGCTTINACYQDVWP